MFPTFSPKNIVSDISDAWTAWLDAYRIKGRDKQSAAEQTCCLRHASDARPYVCVYLGMEKTDGMKLETIRF